MIIYLSIKFHENILNSFHTKLPLSNFKWELLEKMYGKVTVLMLSTSSDDALYFYQVS